MTKNQFNFIKLGKTNHVSIIIVDISECLYLFFTSTFPNYYFPLIASIISFVAAIGIFIERPYLNKSSNYASIAELLSQSIACIVSEVQYHQDESLPRGLIITLWVLFLLISLTFCLFISLFDKFFKPKESC